MYEVDFLAVGEAGRHGDAIAIRFTRPDTGAYAHVVIDAGFDQNAKDLVEHIQEYYDTAAIDLAIVTHPDGPHRRDGPCDSRPRCRRALDPSS